MAFLIFFILFSSEKKAKLLQSAPQPAKAVAPLLAEGEGRMDSKCKQDITAQWQLALARISLYKLLMQFCQKPLFSQLLMAASIPGVEIFS